MSDTSELATNIHRLSSVLGKIGDGTLQQYCGFGMSQFKILWMLNIHREGVLQTTIADWLNLTEAAVSRQIAIMQQDGLVDKVVDPNNRRNHNIMLTAEGKKLAVGSMDALVKEYKPFFDVLSKEEQERLNAMLEKIFYKVCKEYKEGK
jgi:DNA-binding MarR family transcriptional regulator